jgi:lysophospholipase L1-like esterase
VIWPHHFIHLFATIMLVGASNTFEAAPGEGPVWGDQLATRLPQHEVKKWGVPGATAWHWANWIIYFDLKFDGLVVLELGTNDSRIGTYPGDPDLSPATPDQFETRMRYIVGQMHDRGAEWVVLMTPPPNGLPLDDPSHALMEQYSDRIVTICADVDGVDCGPDLLHKLDPELHLMGDLIHYNRRGNNEVRKLLQTFLMTF